MTTRVPIRYGGTGANNATDARTNLGAAPLAAYDAANSASTTANSAYGQANNAFNQANSAYAAANTANTNALNAYTQANSAYLQANNAYGQANLAYDQANSAYGQANSAYGQANDAYSTANTANATANLAYNAANSAANTVRVSQNGSSTLSAKQLNFVNTANVVIAVTDSGDGNANVSFDLTTGGGTLSNIAISSNGVFATNANAFNFVNTATVSVTVAPGVDGNANISFTSVGGGGGGLSNTIIKTTSFTAANADANLTYTLPITPIGTPYLFVIKNGITLTPNTDYSVTGTTLTVIESGAANDVIEVRYFDQINIYENPNTQIIIDSNTAVAQTNTFTLSQNVSSINRLAVSKNGLQLTPNLHFVVTNNTVTLNTVAEINDVLTFTHFRDLGDVSDLTISIAAYDQANAAYNVANTKLNTSGGTLTGTLTSRDIIPSANITYNIGSSTARFNDIWLSNSTIYLGGAELRANGDKLVVGGIELASGANVVADVDAAYSQANAAYAQANAAYGQANLAYGQANSAYGQANDAFAAANNANLKSGGTISGDLIVTGNLTISGNSTTLNTETLLVEDNEIVLNANVTGSPTLNSGIIVNRGSSTNTFLRWNEDADKWGWSDNGTTFYSFDTSLTAYAQANAAYAQANSAYGAANNAVLKSGDTMTGALAIAVDNSTAPTNGGGSFINIINSNTTSSAIGSILFSAYDSGGSPRHGSAITFSKESNWVGASGNYPGVLSFYTRPAGGDETERLRITSNGNIGIGITPFDKLDVNGGATIRGALSIYSTSAMLTSTGNGYQAFNIDNGTVTVALTTNSNQGELRTVTNHPFLFFTNNSEKMRITASGNVGIGTATANAPLAFSTALGSAGEANKIHFYENGDNIWGMGMSNGLLHVRGGQYSSIAFYTSPDTSAPSEKLRITGAGNIGIGTTSPTDFGGRNLSIHSPSNSTYASQLWVSGAYVMQALINEVGGVMSLGSRSNHKFELCTNDTTRITISNTGNVGVGVTSPTFKFVAGNSGTDAGWMYSTGAVSVLGLGGFGNSGDGAFQLRYDRATGFFTFNGGTRDTPIARITVNNNGNVGIGTSNPGRPLTVYSASADNHITVGNNAPSISLTNDPTNPNGATQTYIIALATSAGNYSIGSGDFLIGGVGNSRGNVIINSNYSGTGTKNVVLQPSAGNVGVGTSSPGGKFVVQDGISHTSGVPTYRGSFILTNGGGNTTSAGGFEFHSSTYESGFGWRISTPDLGAGSTPLVFQSRTNSASWTEVMRLDNLSGRLGIGTSSPSQALHVVASTSTGTTGIRVDGQFGSGYFGTYTNYPAIMYDSSGLKPVIVYDTNNNLTQLYTANTERMRIDGSGNFAFGSQFKIVTGTASSAGGTTGNSAGFNHAGVFIDRGWGDYPGMSVCNANAAGNGQQGQFRFHGTNCSFNSYPSTSGGDFSVQVWSDGGFYDASDRRFKRNITTIPNALDKVLSMTGRRFQFINSDGVIEEQHTQNGFRFGFVAQELQEAGIDEVYKHHPEDDDGTEGYNKAYAVHYGSVTALLVEAIKELKAELDAAKNRITELENR